MIRYIAPAIWFVVGAGNGVLWLWMSRPEVLSRRSDEQLRNMRSAFVGRRHLLFMGALAVLALAATVRGAWTGTETWWAWLLATVSLGFCMAAREKAATRYFAHLGEPRGPEGYQEARRERLLLIASAI